MTVEIPAKSCPRCNSEISVDAPGGLCPRCLMQFVAMSTGGGGDLSADDRLPPALETVRAAFPHLEILELVGQGGMGAVYKARQTKLDRIVALKILPQRLAREPQFADRFEREGRLLAKLNHPNIVGVHDFGQADGLYFLMMEYVDGVNLRQAFASSNFTPAQALQVIPKICEALQFAHDEGVLHRDIKPENILLDTKGRVKIADFGVAKFSGVDDKTGLTATGATIGTPHYMAPEQIERPSDVDHRADIFSLGVVFYEMLTGELPLGRFAAPSERTETLDTRIDQVVMRALEKDRERRQQSANEVRTQVEFLSKHSASQPASSIPVPAAKPPVLELNKLVPRNTARPKLAMALVVASTLIPALTATYLSSTHPRIPFHSAMLTAWSYLAMIALWLGVPGTLLGAMHLRYLGRSGERTGLWMSVLASTFWPFAIAVGFFLFVAMKALEFIHSGNSNAVEPLEVTLVLAVGLVSIVFGVRAIHRWVNQSPPQMGVANNREPGDPVLRVVFQVFAGTLWIFFGLGIIFLAPVGTLERTLLVLGFIGLAVMGTWSVKRWIEGTSPEAQGLVQPMHPVDIAIRNILTGFAVLVWIGSMVLATYWIPIRKEATQLAQATAPPIQTTSQETKYMNLDIASITTYQNILVIDIIDGDSSNSMDMVGLGGMIESMGGESPPGSMDGSNAEGNFETTFRIDFQGPKLSPEATTAASNSYDGVCFFPGVRSEQLTFDLSAGKTATLAFVFPDTKAAQACKLRIERLLHSGQWPAAIAINGTKTLLFQANTAHGEYSVYAEPYR